MSRLTRAREARGDRPIEGLKVDLRIGSVCSGYEGLGMGVQDVIGGELTWVADNDPGASKILAHRFPAVKNLGDITAVNWATAESVDVLLAGFPCQDISAAGKRAGLRRGTRSGLWHEIADAIGTLRPQLVVIENVRALLTARGDDPTPEHLAAEASRNTCGRLLEWLANEANIAHKKEDWDRVRECSARTIRVMGLRKRAVARCEWHERRLVRAIGTVCGSLADLGYDTQWVTISAADVGAPHRRERIFIAAWPPADASGGQLQRRGIPRVLGSAPPSELGEGDQREWAGNASGDSGQAVAADAAPADQRWRGGSGESAESAGWTEPDDGGLGASADAAGGGRTAGSRRGDGRPPPVGGEEVGPPEDGAVEDADSAAGGERRQPASGQAPGGRPRPDAGGSGGAPAADAERDGLEGPRIATGQDQERPAPAPVGRRPAKRGVAPAHACRAGLEVGPVACDGPECPAAERSRGNAAADADGWGLESVRVAEPAEQQSARRCEPDGCDPDGKLDHAPDWGTYEPAIRRWEAVTGRRAPRPTDPGRTGERLSPAFVEWMMGLPAGWVTDVPGLTRNEQLRALGNGVVPQQAAMAVRLLLMAVQAGEAA